MPGGHQSPWSYSPHLPPCPCWAVLFLPPAGEASPRIASACSLSITVPCPRTAGGWDAPPSPQTAPSPCAPAVRTAASSPLGHPHVPCPRWVGSRSAGWFCPAPALLLMQPMLYLWKKYPSGWASSKMRHFAEHWSLACSLWRAEDPRCWQQRLVLAPSLARSWAAHTEQGYGLSPHAFPVVF